MQHLYNLSKLHNNTYFRAVRATSTARKKARQKKVFLYFFILVRSFVAKGRTFF